MRDRFAHDLIGLQSPTDVAYLSRYVDTETLADVLVMKVMRAAAHTVLEDADLDPRILDELAIAGVDSWGDSAVVFRYRFRSRYRNSRPAPHRVRRPGSQRQGTGLGIREMATPRRPCVLDTASAPRIEGTSGPQQCR
ncbi:MAG: hypothetical protein Q8K21_09480 [Hydrogenophaga sp.]|uniref:hypothetical protein n=1 Tax=Hydrogenophaga sp. TaxID=1904254 RepID=UPI0027318394|nr:hypothetical protein [Hydrogenophaga sp.]MDP2164431.1 hypothetical protein [Hydrogenophaga sp.]MDP3475090.1 hypothetical protein [Hydrogenophaga sp.]